MAKAFRTDESLRIEQETRDLIKPFLAEKGFSSIQERLTRSGTALSQSISAQLPDGKPAEMRVKLCWRPRGKTASEVPYWAAQLVAKVEPGTSEVSVQKFAARAASHCTHFLFIQPDAGEIAAAALVETNQLLDIWKAQRNVSARLLATNRAGRYTSNLAENGHSPTLYLKHEQFPEVARVLWEHRGVLNVSTLFGEGGAPADSFQDTVILDYSIEVGRDDPPRIIGKYSYVKRDDRVRRIVLKRAKGQCERPGCRLAKPYQGFLDVHHILGAGVSDRVWNCVALCPNCHREAHVSPKLEELNCELLKFAQQFRN